MNFDKVAYKKEIEKRASAKSPVFSNCLRAFLVGAVICGSAQALFFLYEKLGLSSQNAAICVTVTVIFSTAILTGLGIFDNIARFAGAGTIVPVTGFANSVAAAALDNKSEGLVMGVGAKIFSVAGPVILYGILCGAVYGVIYFVLFALGVL
ncbi:MAG: SpoVA/SpoVAEb family sporulation membrane protein [Clostridia bacterium]|nr:SpoVA/SpoVAEb family sporulation membrane protein [Clostridia bacterium]MBO7150427.1 SpoVA/SpoVAEb family sporulation membrane protein [Clostridia bacterium]